jgi:hypothetical protein
VCITGWTSFFSTSSGQQELMLIFLHLASIAMTVVYTLSTGATHTLYATLASRIVISCVVLRTFRIVFLFPRLRRTMAVFISSLKAFLPLFVSILCIYIFYGVIGTALLKSSSIDLGNTFLQTNYHFETYYHATITLLAMSTGNLWSEIVNAYVYHTSGWKRTLINFYFITFYLLINALLRALVIALIAKFLERSGDHDAIATQQIQLFRRLWRRIALPGNHSMTTKNQLISFLSKLRAPLGINRHESHCANAVERFYQRLHLNLLKIKEPLQIWSEENIRKAVLET